jgi:hypothetical protein
MSENVVLRKTFRPRQEEVRSIWRKLHNEELCDVIYILLQKLLG